MAALLRLPRAAELQVGAACNQSAVVPVGSSGPQATMAAVAAVAAAASQDEVGTAEDEQRRANHRKKRKKEKRRKGNIGKKTQG